MNGKMIGCDYFLNSTFILFSNNDFETCCKQAMHLYEYFILVNSVCDTYTPHKGFPCYFFKKLPFRPLKSDEREYERECVEMGFWDLFIL